MLVTKIILTSTYDDIFRNLVFQFNMVKLNTPVYFPNAEYATSNKYTFKTYDCINFQTFLP